MFQPQDIYEDLVKLGTEWADAEEVADLLEETKKTLIAQLAAECQEKSVAAKEAYAYAHKEYVEHLKVMTSARKTANRAKVRYDSRRVFAELLRTQAATERAANRYSA